MKKFLAGLIGVSLILTGCLAGPRDEKQAFIDATIEATCLIFDSENIFDPAVEENAKAIYADYGFDVDDEAKMEEISKKYAEDTEVQTAIIAGIEKCSPGVTDLLGGGETEAPAEEPAVEAPAEEEAAAEEAAEPAVEEAATEEPAAEEAAQ